MAFSPTQPMLAFGRSQILPIIPLSPPSYCAHPNVLGMSPSSPQRIQVPSPSRDRPTRPSADSRRLRRDGQTQDINGQTQDIKVDKNFHFFLDLDGIVPGYVVRTHQLMPVSAAIRFGPDRLHCTGG
jgi:hypothetical protein